MSALYFVYGLCWGGGGRGSSLVVWAVFGWTCGSVWSVQCGEGLDVARVVWDPCSLGIVLFVVLWRQVLRLRYIGGVFWIVGGRVLVCVGGWESLLGIWWQG